MPAVAESLEAQQSLGLFHDRMEPLIRLRHLLNRDAVGLQVGAKLDALPRVNPATIDLIAFANLPVAFLHEVVIHRLAGRGDDEPLPHPFVERRVCSRRHTLDAFLGEEDERENVDPVAVLIGEDVTRRSEVVHRREVVAAVTGAPLDVLDDVLGLPQFGANPGDFSGSPDAEIQPLHDVFLLPIFHNISFVSSLY